MHLPLGRNRRKVLLIRLGGLNAQRRGENKLPDCRAEAGEEGVEGLLLYHMLATYTTRDLSPCLPLDKSQIIVWMSTYVIPRQDTIHKLQDPHHHQEGHKRIEQLRPLGCGFLVVGCQVGDDLVPGLGDGRGGGGFG